MSSKPEEYMMEPIDDPKLEGPDAIAPAAELETTDIAKTWRKSGRRGARRAAAKPAPKPTHYKVICVSIYTKDLEQLDAKVAELKRRGKTKMSKSELIRLALANLNIDEVA